MDELSVRRIEAALTTAFIGRSLAYLPEVTSTNDVARHLAVAGAADGTVVIADHQTAGRGRLERPWVAPPGSSLLLSLVLRPPLAPHQAQRLTMACGLAVLDAVKGATGLELSLKWPNDVLAGENKVAGILTELDLRPGSPCRIDYAIVGIGINVNLAAGELPAELIVPAASLSSLLGDRVPRLPLLVALLAAIEERYVAVRAGRSPHDEWAQRLITLGRRVTVSGGGGAMEGVAEGVEQDGALLLRLDDGRLERVLAGDVTLVRGAPGAPSISGPAPAV
ncbi:MAG: biotin--[acetyl-CoA-carboxylase] ligase [Anaerolineae bacterium]|nr:biotin--[acetyl-CoA-carboxylase] ligase [Anaerolineae bacterium]